MKLLVAVAFAFTFAAQACAAEDSFQSALRAPTAADPALYSFADVYRLTANALYAPGGFPAEAGEGAPVRVALAPATPPSELRFAVAPSPQPKGWLLLLAGVALAAWVARRRVGYLF